MQCRNAHNRYEEILAQASQAKASGANEGQWRLTLEHFNTEVTKLRALHVVALPIEHLVHKTKKLPSDPGPAHRQEDEGKEGDFLPGLWNLVASLVNTSTMGEKLQKMYPKIMVQTGLEGREEDGGGQKRNNDQVS